MSTNTIYDVDTHGCELVRAPFRVRTELRHAPPAHQAGWREPAACTTNSVQLDTFRNTTVVGRAVSAGPSDAPSNHRSPTMSTSNYRLPPLPTAQDVINARRWGRFESAVVCVCAVLLALAISRAPVTDAEIEALMAAENAAAIAQADAAAAAEPCWDQLPMRKAITQANIDRLCIKVQPVRAGNVGVRE